MVDFGYDAKKLANHLDRVSNDFNIYRSYFEWKRKYTAIYDAESVEQMRMCELCAKLNNQHIYSNHFYNRVTDFVDSACNYS